MTVYNLDEAMKFFLRNSSGLVVCVKDNGEYKECSCYSEAVEFFSLLD